MINKNFLNKYKGILSISQENIELEKNPLLLTRQAELGFDNSKKSWILYYNVVQSEFPFIHELGHIHFAIKKSGYIYFALPPPPNSELDRSLGNLINNLLDCFINYNLSEFKEFYPFIRQNNFFYLDQLGDFQNKIESINNFYTLLEWYLLFYIEFKFILKKEDYKKRNQDIDSLLKILKSNLLNFNHFSENNINKLTKCLDKFNEEKNKTRAVRIIAYFIYVLLNINFWTKEELKKQMILFFPNFKKF